MKLKYWLLYVFVIVIIAARSLLIGQTYTAMDAFRAGRLDTTGSRYSIIDAAYGESMKFRTNYSQIQFDVQSVDIYLRNVSTGAVDAPAFTVLNGNSFQMSVDGWYFAYTNNGSPVHIKMNNAIYDDSVSPVLNTDAFMDSVRYPQITDIDTLVLPFWDSAFLVSWNANTEEDLNHYEAGLHNGVDYSVYYNSVIDTFVNVEYWVDSGQYTAYVFAVDDSGNISAPGEKIFYLLRPDKPYTDNTPPDSVYNVRVRPDSSKVLYFVD